jgi:hypothetical protein
MREITLWVFDKLLSIIPSILLRLFCSPKKVASQVKVNLRGEKPISPSLNFSVPYVEIYLEITNLSNLDLFLDRMLIDLWVGQPVLVGAILKRTKISSRSTGQQVLFRSNLSSKQVQQIEPMMSQTPPGQSITLYINTYLESKVGIVEIKNIFERREI